MVPADSIALRLCDALFSRLEGTVYSHPLSLQDGWSMTILRRRLLSLLPLRQGIVVCLGTRDGLQCSSRWSAGIDLALDWAVHPPRPRFLSLRAPGYTFSSPDGIYEHIFYRLT